MLRQVTEGDCTLIFAAAEVMLAHAAGIQARHTKDGVVDWSSAPAAEVKQAANYKAFAVRLTGLYTRLKQGKK